MAYICEICGKKGSLGHSRKHKRGVAGRRWRKRAQVTTRLFKPNLQRVTLKIDEKVKKMRICTKCLKRIKKFGCLKEFKNIAVV